MKKFYLFHVFFAICTLTYSQCTLLPNAIPGLTLVHQNTNCFNNSGVAFNPNFNLYYGVRAGNPSFPLETWTSTGAPLYNTSAGFDWRGMWWNPVTNQLEGNGFSTYGIWKADLNISGWALNTGVYIFTGMNQPNAQSVGDLDYQAYEILYYDNGSIFRYSRATNAFLGSYPITGTPVPLSNLNWTTLMYTGCPGKEIALLDYVNRRVYVYNKANGAYVGMSQLPGGAVTTSSYRTSWANCYVWLFNLANYTWYSYQIFNSCLSCPPVFTTQNLSICTGDSLFVGGAWQNTTGAYIDSLTTSNGCDSVVTTNLTILSTVSVSPNLAICNGTSATLTASGTTTYAWSPGTGLNTTTGSTVIASPTVTTTYTVTGTINACTSTASVQVTVNPVYSQNVSAVICNGTVYTFPDGSTSNVPTTHTSTLSTILGCDSLIITSLSVNPTYSINNPQTICAGQVYTFNSHNYNVTGTYYDTLMTHAGCDSIIVTQLTVTPLPGISVNPPAATVCPGDTITLVASGATTYLWSNGLGTSNTVTVIMNTTTTYTVTGTAIGCSSTASVAITVNPIPTVTITASANPICEGTPISLTANGASTYVWSDGSVANPATVAPVSATTYTVTGTLNGCTNTAEITITTNTMPYVSLGTDTTICPGIPMILDAGSSIYTYLWSNNSTTQSITATTAGTYWVNVTNFPCVATDSIHVFLTPQLDLGPDASLCEITAVDLHSNIAASTYLWSTGATTPSIEVDMAGVYWIEVNFDNCILSDTIRITGATYSGLFVPTAFTPNDDGLNDIFKADGEGISVYDLRVFTRWGEMIFHSQDMNQGWDGTFKGLPVQLGVYVWVLDYQTTCTGDEKRQKHGFVMLLQ